ncbi:MAG: VOC family protein [Alphaproteobacteria bacterium]|nr:VOC family protein [Alphaproteobacteria bacterium]
MTMQQGTFGWNELMTTDVAKSKAFFTKLIGWTTSDMPMPGGQGTYTLMHSAGKPVAGMMAMAGEQWKGVPAHWMAYIAVDDVDAPAGKVPELVGKVCLPPTDIPGVGRFCVISDPSGATVSLMTFKM